jgi:hypothetical protein
VKTKYIELIQNARNKLTVFFFSPGSSETPLQAENYFFLVVAVRLKEAPATA